MDGDKSYSNFSITEEFKREVIEHGVKIKNIEGIVVDSDKKIDTINDNIQQIKISIASKPNCDPIMCANHTTLIELLTKRAKDSENTITNLVTTKNRLVGAMSLGAIFGSVIGIVGTWITTLMLRTPK